MPDIETVSTWRGRTLLDRDSGRGRISTIDAIYLDDQTGSPSGPCTAGASAGCIAVTVVGGTALNLT